MPRKLSTCHPNKIAKGRGLCGACYDKVLKKENPEYRDLQLKNTKNWVSKNPDKCKKIQDKYAKTKKAYSTKRNNALKNKYGITLDDYNKMFSIQNGSCKLCNKTHKNNKPLHVDHCHKTNKVRGLLCFSCNWYMSNIDNDPDILFRLWAYYNSEGIVDLNNYTIYPEGV